MGASGVFILGPHALLRARQGNIRPLDIRNALTGATAATLQDNDRMVGHGGVDLQGVPVTLIVSFYRGFLIVTLY